MNVSVSISHIIWKHDIEPTTLCHAKIWRLICCQHWRQVLLEFDLKLAIFTCVTSTYPSRVCSIKISLVPNCCDTNWHTQGKCVVAVSTPQGSFSLPPMRFYWCRWETSHGDTFDIFLSLELMVKPLLVINSILEHIWHQVSLPWKVSTHFSVLNFLWMLH